jgi:hypothetical protein
MGERRAKQKPRKMRKTNDTEAEAVAKDCISLNNKWCAPQIDLTFWILSFFFWNVWKLPGVVDEQVLLGNHYGGERGWTGKRRRREGGGSSVVQADDDNRKSVWERIFFEAAWKTVGETTGPANENIKKG